MLHHVVDYARKHVTDSERGFTRREIFWRIAIKPDGTFAAVLPLLDRKAKHRAKTPGCPDMPNMRAGGDAKRSHFLVEAAGAALLYDNDHEMLYRVADHKTMRRHEFFRKIMGQAAETLDKMSPISNFLRNDEQMRLCRARAGELRINPSDWISFVVQEYDPLQDQQVLHWWREWLMSDSTSRLDSGGKRSRKTQGYVDLLTGREAHPLERHPLIKGMNKGLGKDGGDAQAPLIAMDKAAFESFGLRSGFNAAMAPETAQLYADGLSDLLEKSVVVAGTKVAYWFKSAIPPEDFDPFAALAGLESTQTKELGALTAARNALNATQSGTRSGSLRNHYFAMTVSGLKGRIMIRSWMEGDFAELLSNSIKWFEDLEIVGLTGTRSAPDPKLESVVTAPLPDRLPSQKYSDWIRPLGSARVDLWRCALDANRPIPPSMLSRMMQSMPRLMASDPVLRILFPKRTDSEDSEAGLTVARLYSRMSFVKAYFNRTIRSRNGGTEMEAHLNINHPNPAYHCGRLLAILAKLQEKALGDVGANVVQRFYPAFSQTPGLIVGRLVSNARNHLGKLDGGLAWWYEERIAEIMTRLGDGAPRTLNLEGQGLFALGYYQQIAALRAGKKGGTADAATNNQQGGSTT